jgi:hypothetical protein
MILLRPSRHWQHDQHQEHLLYFHFISFILLINVYYYPLAPCSYRQEQAELAIAESTANLAYSPQKSVIFSHFL